MKNAKCTNCGAELRVDESKDSGICPYCQSAYVTEKAINNFTSTINNTTTTNAQTIVNNYYASPSQPIQNIQPAQPAQTEQSTQPEQIKQNKLIIKEKKEKKWVCAIPCFLFGLSVYFIMASVWFFKISIFYENLYYSGFNLIRDVDLSTLANTIGSSALGVYRVFAIILLFIAGLSIVYSIFKILASKNVLNIPKVVDYIFIFVFIFAVISAIVILVALLNFKSDILSYYNSISITVESSTGVIFLLLATTLTSVASIAGILGKKKS